MAPALEMRGVEKRFGPTHALRGVDLDLREGEIHALVGENGAGKSTLVKVLSGAVVPDAGEVTIRGARYRPGDPLAALRRGVAMIYQELTLAPRLSVEENATLGFEPVRAGFIRREHRRAAVRAALSRLGHGDLPVTARVGTLSTGLQQIVEIARALLHRPTILIMDEPTSSLSTEDARRLFDVVRRLPDDGVTVVYISHLLEEVRQVADRCTVLRDGRVVATAPAASTAPETIVEWMIGRRLEEMFPRVAHEPGEPVLDIGALSGARQRSRGDKAAFADVSLTLRRGEILGIAGLVGAGRTELVRAVYGLEPVAGGDIRVLTASGAILRGTRPPDRVRQGLGYLSEDRKAEGLAVRRSVADNITLSRLGPYTRLGWLSRSAQRRGAAAWTERLSIRTTGPGQPVSSLSGGNQQKVALARLLHQDADIFLLDEPTRGIDVGSKVEIYRLMGEAAARGTAILFVSSYIPELLGVCDRICVMSRGRLGPAYLRDAVSENDLLFEAMGGREAGSPEGAA